MRELTEIEYGQDKGCIQLPFLVGIARLVAVNQGLILEK